MQAAVHWSIVIMLPLNILSSFICMFNRFPLFCINVVGSLITEKHLNKKKIKITFGITSRPLRCFSSNMLVAPSVSSSIQTALLSSRKNRRCGWTAPSSLLQPVAPPEFLWLSSPPLWFCHELTEDSCCWSWSSSNETSDSEFAFTKSKFPSHRGAKLPISGRRTATLNYI